MARFTSRWWNVYVLKFKMCDVFTFRYSVNRELRLRIFFKGLHAWIFPFSHLRIIFDFYSFLLITTEEIFLFPTFPFECKKTTANVRREKIICISFGRELIASHYFDQNGNVKFMENRVFFLFHIIFHAGKILSGIFFSSFSNLFSIVFPKYGEGKK